MITIPATLLGLLAGIASVAWRGPELADDPEYQRRLAATPVAPAKTALAAAPPDPFTRAAIGCCLIFLAALVAVVLLGIFPDLRPEYTQVTASGSKTGRVEMSRAIMILMLAAAGAMMLLFRPDPAKALAGSVMRGGLVAVVCILGVSWMGSSFFTANEAAIVGGISRTVAGASLGFRRRPLRALAPAVQPGGGDRHPRAGRHRRSACRHRSWSALYPAVNGNFFLPTYGTVLAAVSFDQTGTTRIGSYVVNHSFMRPGLVTTIVATCTSLALARLVLG